MCRHEPDKLIETVDPTRPLFVRTTCKCGKFFGYRDLEKTGEVPSAKPQRKSRTRVSGKTGARAGA